MAGGIGFFGSRLGDMNGSHKATSNEVRHPTGIVGPLNEERQRERFPCDSPRERLSTTSDSYENFAGLHGLGSSFAKRCVPVAPPLYWCDLP